MALRAKQLTDTTAWAAGEDIYVFAIWTGALSTAQVVLTGSRKGQAADTLLDTGSITAASGVDLEFARGLGPYDTLQATTNGSSNVWIYYDVQAGGR